MGGFFYECEAYLNKERVPLLGGMAGPLFASFICGLNKQRSCRVMRRCKKIGSFRPLSDYPARLPLVECLAAVFVPDLIERFLAALGFVFLCAVIPCGFLRGEK